MTWNEWKWPLLVAGGVGLVLWGFHWYWLEAPVWDFLHSPSDNFHYFCEQSTREGLFRQTGNSLSNLGFLAVGLWILGEVRHHRLQGLARAMGILYGWVAVGMFVGSTFFHASLSDVGEGVDLSAVYGLVLVPPVWLISRQWVPRRPGVGIGIWAIAWAACTYWMWEWPSHWLIPGLIVLTVVLLLGQQAHRHPSRVWWWSSGILIGMGILCFVGDLQRTGCSPEAPLHPHGLWHLFAAGGAALMFRFLRSFE